MTSSIDVCIKSAVDLSVADIMAIYALVDQTGYPFEPGYLESAHLAHNPTMVLAYRAGQLVGVQSYSHYRLRTPFRHQTMTVFYVGVAFVHPIMARQGIAHRLVSRYMQYALGHFWLLRSYVLLFRTNNPRLIQLTDLNHRLYLSATHTLSPALVDFVNGFMKQERGMQLSINSDLVMTAPDTHVDITHQWPTLYCASRPSFNQLAIRHNLISEADGRYFATGKLLLVIGRSSRIKLLNALCRTLMSRFNALTTYMQWLPNKLSSSSANWKRNVPAP